MVAQYAVLRVAKLKTMGEIGALGQHNERTRDTPNADAERLGENVRLVGSGDWCADAQARLDAAPRIRSNAVLAIEHVMTGGDNDSCILGPFGLRPGAASRELCVDNSCAIM